MARRNQSRELPSDGSVLSGVRHAIHERHGLLVHDRAKGSGLILLQSQITTTVDRARQRMHLSAQSFCTGLQTPTVLLQCYEAER
jgi:hypothetical protein